MKTITLTQLRQFAETHNIRLNKPENLLDNSYTLFECLPNSEPREINRRSNRR